MQNATDIIFVSLEPWDDVWRRNQFFCDELARRKPTRRILFVGPAVDFSAAVRECRLDKALGGGTRTLERWPNITVTRPAKFLPNSFAATRGFTEAAARRHVRRAAKRLGFYRDGRRPVLWINDPFAEGLAGRLNEAGIVYDITDDWTQFGRDSVVRRRLIERDHRLSQRADAIIVCSEALEASKRDYAHKLHLIKNGVDCSHYRSVLEGKGDGGSKGGGDLPDAAQRWDKPVLGYTGTIHHDRLDVDLVAELAEYMDRGSIVLMGPNHLTAEERSRLKATGRVIVSGPVSYAELPRYMRGFDVCIVPHRVTPFTESLNPIKLWEYLASGKPIVSTPVAGFRDFCEHVLLADDAAAFATAADRAASENASKAAARQRLAGQHSWTRRVDDVEQVLAHAGDSKRAAESPCP